MHQADLRTVYLDLRFIPGFFVDVEKEMIRWGNIRLPGESRVSEQQQ